MRARLAHERAMQAYLRAAQAHDAAARRHDEMADIGHGDVEGHRRRAREHREASASDRRRITEQRDRDV
jgi:hypothetical protein